MNKLNIIIWILSLLLSCQGQIKKNQGKANGTLLDTSIINIDPIEPMPYVVERDTMYHSLPDSLGGKEVNGMAVLKLNINKDGKIQDFSIIKLSIFKNEKEIINYWCNTCGFLPKKDYPSNVLRYYLYLKAYVDSLKITKAINIRPKQENIIYKTLRF